MRVRKPKKTLHGQRLSRVLLRSFQFIIDIRDGRGLGPNVSCDV